MSKPMLFEASLNFGPHEPPMIGFFWSIPQVGDVVLVTDLPNKKFRVQARTASCKSAADHGFAPKDGLEGEQWTLLLTPIPSFDD